MIVTRQYGSFACVDCAEREIAACWIPNMVLAFAQGVVVARSGPYGRPARSALQVMLDLGRAVILPTFADLEIAACSAAIDLGCHFRNTAGWDLHSASGQLHMPTSCRARCGPLSMYTAQHGRRLLCLLRGLTRSKQGRGDDQERDHRL
jgi:hypothetical protein